MTLLTHGDLRRIAGKCPPTRGRDHDAPGVVLRVRSNPVDLTGTVLGPGSTFDVDAYIPDGDRPHLRESFRVFVDAVTGERVEIAYDALGDGEREVRFSAFLPEDAGELVEIALAANARYVRVVPPTSATDAEVWLMVGDTLQLWRRLPAEFHAILDANLSSGKTREALAGRFPGRLLEASFDRREDGRVDVVVACTPDEDERSENEFRRREDATAPRGDRRAPEDLERACDPDRLRALGTALEDRRRNATGLAPNPDAPARRFGSFLRGRPAWPHGMAWPATLDGKPLDFLCQVACSDLVGMPGFPDAGLLQFFVSDEGYGADGDDGGVPGGTRVIWHPETGFPVDEETIPQARPRAGLPFDAAGPPVALTPEGITMTEGVGEASFDANNPGFAEGYGAERGDLLNDVPPVHYVGGWPRSVQGMLAYERDDVVLARFDSDEYLDWGRAGTAHFILSSEALAARRFDDARFAWDTA